MDPDTVVSTVGVLIALAALSLTIFQAHLTRRHNRLSVRPVLDFPETFPPGGRAGLRLVNVGLGPADILSGAIWLDGVKRSEPFGKPVMDALRDERDVAQRRPSATSFTPGAVLPRDFNVYVLSLDDSNPRKDADFVRFVQRLRIEITYDSLYGDKRVLEWPQPSPEPEAGPMTCGDAPGNSGTDSPGATWGLRPARSAHSSRIGLPSYSAGSTRYRSISGPQPEGINSIVERYQGAAEAEAEPPSSDHRFALKGPDQSSRTPAARLRVQG